MREITTLKLIQQFMELVGQCSPEPMDIYLVGGATAVLHGWRDTTIDVDLKMSPEADSLLRQIPAIKEKLKINVELASPADFIPELPDWKERRLFVGQHGKVRFYHYDPYAQALSKIERGHAQDTEDVEAMFKNGLIESGKLLMLFKSIENQLYKFPAIDPPSFRKAVQEIASRHKAFP